MIKDYVYRKIPLNDYTRELVLQEWTVKHRPAYYDIDTSRERMSPALSRTRTYHLRRPNVDASTIVRTESTQNVLDCVDTPLYAQFPVLRQAIEEVGRLLYGGWTHLGRVFITRLEADANIGRHIDEGHYFESLHRHHIVLRCKDSRFCWDEEFLVLKTGDAVVVNNSIPHWVSNSNEPRTHVIFDGA